MIEHRPTFPYPGLMHVDYGDKGEAWFSRDGSFLNHNDLPLIRKALEAYEIGGWKGTHQQHYSLAAYRWQVERSNG